jgi:large subunit ribosomal protein L9
MKIILSEKINNLGNLGDIVQVKPGYARNYLLPQGKAIRATKDNIEIFEKERSIREEENNKNKVEAETGLLYGSVSTRDISKLLQNKDYSITHKQVILDKTIKDLGIYNVEIKLHPEVSKDIKLNVARTEEEALIQDKTGKAVVESKEENDDDNISPENINKNITNEDLELESNLKNIPSDVLKNDKIADDIKDKSSEK